MSGPLWTRARLTRVMCLRFGFTSHGAVDTEAAAQEMGVSRRTVQRWLHASHGRSLAHIPAKRLTQLIDLLTPPPDVIAKESQQARYAADALQVIENPGPLGLNPAWTRQRWLEPHLVVVLEIQVRHLRIRQLAVGRQTPTKLAELAKRGRIVDQVVVPTRFHATMLTHQVLTNLGPWRFEAGQDQVRQGFTQAWLADAPPAHLQLLADQMLGTVAEQASPDTPSTPAEDPGADRGQAESPTPDTDEDQDQDQGSGDAAQPLPSEDAAPETDAVAHNGQDQWVQRVEHLVGALLHRLRRP